MEPASNTSALPCPVLSHERGGGGVSAEWEVQELCNKKKKWLQKQ